MSEGRKEGCYLPQPETPQSSRLSGACNTRRFGVFWQNLPAPEVLSPEDTDDDEDQCVELSSLLAVPLMARMTREELFSDRLTLAT